MTPPLVELIGGRWDGAVVRPKPGTWARGAVVVAYCDTHQDSYCLCKDLCLYGYFEDENLGCGTYRIVEEEQSEVEPG